MNGNVKTAALSFHKDSLDNTRHALSKGARGRSWRRVTVRCTTDVCGVTAIPSYVSNPNLRYAPLTDAADALSRRVTVLMHYERMRRYGSTESRRTETCSVEGCGRKHYAKGYCNMHYNRQRNRGIEKAQGRRQPKVCSVDGCGRRHKERGYCSMHYTRQWRKGSVKSSC